MSIAYAIIEFEKQLHSAVVILDSGFGSRPGENDRIYRKRKEMAEIALQALRAQQEAEQGCDKCSGIVYRQTTSGKIIPIEQKCSVKITPPCYQPDGDGCAYQVYGDNNDEPIERCKECPLCYSDKVRHQEVEKNEPLTMEELREMANKPKMTKAEIIKSLLDQALDRDSFVDDEDPDCIFAHDAKALREAAELLKVIPEWISVKDRTPCLAVDKFKQILFIRKSVSFRIDGERRAFDAEDFDLETMDFKTVMVDGKEVKLCTEITHWMPLPKPPEREKPKC